MMNVSAKSGKILFLFVLVCALVQPMHMAVILTVLTGTDLAMYCTFSANETDTYVWEDISTNTTLYTIGDNITKTEEAKGNSKYDNFDIFSDFPIQTALEIIDVGIDDHGTYSCNLLDKTLPTAPTRVVNVEAQPLFVDISCINSDDCSSSPTGPSSLSVLCTCKAEGVYPDTLRFTGNGDSSTRSSVTPTLSGPNGSFDISADFEVEDSTDNFECALVGYKNKVNTGRTTATYEFHQPHCELQVTSDEACTKATLNCACNNAVPDVQLYSFYDEEKNLLQEPGTSGVVETELQEGLSTFYCRGCNGVNYGFNRLVSDYVKCVDNAGNQIVGLQMSFVVSVGVALVLLIA